MIAGEALSASWGLVSQAGIYILFDQGPLLMGRGGRHFLSGHYLPRINICGSSFLEMDAVSELYFLSFFPPSGPSGIAAC